MKEPSAYQPSLLVTGVKNAVAGPIKRIVATQIPLRLVQQKAPTDNIIGLGIDGMTSGIMPKAGDRRRVVSEQNSLNRCSESHIGSVRPRQGAPPEIVFEVHAIGAVIINRFDVVRDLG